MPGKETMGVRHFLFEVVEVVRAQLPRDLRDFHVIGPMFTMVKLHYGNPKVHYEVWVQRKLGIVEVGLHFEVAPEENARYLDALVKERADVLALLGPEVVAERWTESWTRVHREVPLTRLDEEMLFEVATCLSRMVASLQPVVEKPKA